MRPQFQIENSFVLQAKDKTYVFAKLLSHNIDFKLSGISKLGEVEIEDWCDMPRAHDEKGNTRFDLYTFALKNHSDSEKLKVGDIVELF